MESALPVRRAYGKALNQHLDSANEPERGTRRLHLRDVEGGDAGAPYEGVGADLRAARVRAGKDLGEVARALRIGGGHLEAIEEGRFEALPGRAYALGFLRSYAEHLGLDGTAVVEAFKDETSPYAARSKLVFPTPAPAGRSPGARLIAVSVLLVAAVFAGWYTISERERTVVELVPEVPENLTRTIQTESDSTRGDDAAAVADETPQPVRVETVQAVEPEAFAAVDATVADSSGAVAGESLDTTDGLETLEAEGAGEAITLVAVEVDAPASEDSAATSGAPESAGAVIEPSASLETQAAELAPPAETFATRRSPDYVPQVYGAANTDARVVVIAHADSWVQVRGPGEKLLLTRVMRSGDRYRVPNRGDLTMLTGNAGALEIVVDGTRIAPVGEVGEVRRDISLDADRMLAENPSIP